MGGRTLTGYEAFSATVKAPDGSLSAVPVTLAEGGAHYQATLQWLQTGIHKVGKAVHVVPTAISTPAKGTLAKPLPVEKVAVSRLLNGT